MKDADLLEAFVSITIAEERVVETYSDVTAAVKVKQLVLDGPMPFTLRDEIELHRRIIAYADASISSISTLQKLLGLGRLTFPLCHDLLRKFRDCNHHVGYKPFAPYRSEGGARFYIWPVLRRFQPIKDAHADWCDTPCRETIEDLLRENHEYVIALVLDQKRKLSNSVRNPRFFDKYALGEICFGPADSQG